MKSSAATTHGHDFKTVWGERRCVRCTRPEVAVRSAGPGFRACVPVTPRVPPAPTAILGDPESFEIWRTRIRAIRGKEHDHA